MMLFPLAKVGLWMNLCMIAWIMISILLIVVVLIQKGKGGGLSSAFGGGGAGGVLGSQSVGFMTKLTVVIVLVFLGMAVYLNMFYKPTTSDYLKSNSPVNTQQPAGEVPTVPAGDVPAETN